MDEVRIWNKVKTAAEISAQYCMELVGNETGLISYYKMSEGAGMIIGTPLQVQMMLLLPMVIIFG